MSVRLLAFAGIVCGVVLLVLLQQQMPRSATRISNSPEAQGTEPGYVSVNAELIETGDDGQPLYRLRAERIEQRRPGLAGDAWLTEPRLDYQPQPGNHWTLRARQGLLPPGAKRTELRGAVEVDGKPESSTSTMHIRSEQLNLDMQGRIVTSPLLVTVDWAGAHLTGRGLYADIKGGKLRLESPVHGVLAR